MNNLVNEALQITKELGDVIFIGALATYMHTKNTRDSRDIDFVVENQIPDDELISKNYHKSMTGKQPWFTPRGFKIDIYTRGIPGVSLDKIIENSKKFTIKNKGEIRVLGLESLIIAKHKAARDQDIEDLKNIAMHRLSQVDWGVVQEIINDEFTTKQIKTDMKFLSKN
ncbi:MAG: nucleotidyltransferase [Nitrosopumilus sp.]|nr:nucleotidyltransferase [Nitrosopumilus sp.]